MRDAVYFYIEQIRSYYAQAHSIANSITGVLLLLEIAYVGIKISLGDFPTLNDILKKILWLGVWIYFVKNIDTLSDAFVKTLVRMSTSLDPSFDTLDFLSNPMDILQYGFEEIVQYILRDIKDSASGIKLWDAGSAFNVVVLTCLLLGVSLCLIVITLIVLMVQIEYSIVVLCAILLLPFMLFEHTKFIAEKIVPSIAGQGIKLMIIAIVVQLILSAYQLIFREYGSEDSLSILDTLYILTIVGIGVFIIIQSQIYAGVIISGISDTNVGRQAVGLVASAFSAHKILQASRAAESKGSNDDLSEKNLEKYTDSTQTPKQLT